MWCNVEYVRERFGLLLENFRLLCRAKVLDVLKDEAAVAVFPLDTGLLERCELAHAHCLADEQCKDKEFHPNYVACCVSFCKLVYQCL